MDIIILSKSVQPIYEQIYEQISAQIINGVLEADFCLPSIRVVAKELEVSVITVKKAWDILEQNGFIYTRAGKGCFVCPQKTKNLETKKIDMAREKFTKDISFYQNLKITQAELIELIKKEYK